ncbi:aminotransferase class I/II-fold pyridoxal phosphate-dependent enzyme [Streptomyces sp. NPDC040724]|uniref:aminotransferase class I/II-fold pyridoxal phosphate-dependent enzyme n=1 Tax=Streptomyces sp. NPDC040724 TaxID=3155612 RepID=UPI00340B625B
MNLKSCELQSPRTDLLLAEALRRLVPTDLWRYPYQQDLVDLLAEEYAVPPECVALSAGSNTALGTVVDALAVPAGRLIVQDPVFESWLHFASLRSVPVSRCRGVETEGRVPRTTVEAFEAALSSGPPGVAAITNPGNPLGDLVPIDTVRRLARVAEDNGHILVIDDCYGAFAGTEHLSLLGEHGNVLVIRSLSKSWGLAGARLAATFGSASLIDYLQRFRMDSPVSAPTLAIAAHLAGRLTELRQVWHEVAEMRDWFVDQVRVVRPSWVALPSTTNFATFLTEGPGGGDRAAAALAVRGIRVRSVEDMEGLSGCVRISMAGRDAMERVLDGLAAGEDNGAGEP